MNWNDLTYLLSVMRAGNLRQAARLQRVDKSTVARRLMALEEKLGVAVIERTRNGQVSLTEAGRMIARRAEVIEDETRHILRDLGVAQDTVVGRVRLTAVPLIINHLLIPRLRELDRLLPDVALELIADARDLSLVDGDADIAVRLARPRDGGHAVVAWRLGILEYGCFAEKHAAQTSDLPWVGYEPRVHYLQHAEVINDLGTGKGESLSPWSFNDAESLFQALLSGYGKTLLPRPIGAGNPLLVELPMPGIQLPKREVWLMVRRDMRDLQRVDAVINWLVQTLGENGVV